MNNRTFSAFCLLNLATVVLSQWAVIKNSDDRCVEVHVSPKGTGFITNACGQCENQMLYVYPLPRNGNGTNADGGTQTLKIFADDDAFTEIKDYQRKIAKDGEITQNASSVPRFTIISPKTGQGRCMMGSKNVKIQLVDCPTDKPDAKFLWTFDVCGEPEKCDDRAEHTNCQEYFGGKVCDVSCKGGYKKVPGVKNKCLGGRWLKNNPCDLKPSYCQVKKSANMIVKSPEGSIISGNASGVKLFANVTVSCKKGFRLQIQNELLALNKTVLKCTEGTDENGVWSADPSCVALEPKSKKSNTLAGSGCNIFDQEVVIKNGDFILKDGGSDAVTASLKGSYPWKIQKRTKSGLYRIQNTDSLKHIYLLNGTVKLTAEKDETVRTHVEVFCRQNGMVSFKFTEGSYLSIDGSTVLTKTTQDKTTQFEVRPFKSGE